MRSSRELGALVGVRIARNADIVDANPPQLVRYDRWANEVDTVEHHPAMIDSKRAMWECGYVSGFAADEAARGRTTPGVVIAAAHYLVSQADTGLVCSTGMTSGVAGLVDAYAPPDVRATLLAGLRADDFESGIDGSMFLTERDGGSDLGNTVHCTARDLGDGRVQIDGEKWFCSNVDGEAIALLARPEGRDGRIGRARALPRARASRRRQPQPLHDPPAQGQARHQERADRRGRVPRRDRIRAARAARATVRAPTHAG